MRKNIQKTSSKTQRRSLHIPLSLDIYQSLQKQSESYDQPIVKIARQAILEWLQRQQEQEIERQIGEYADACAGVADLDEALEAASIEHWQDTEKHA